MSGGLLISGIVVPIPGVTVHNPTDTPWCKLDPGDYRQRKTSWIRQVLIHTTKGIWPMRVRPGVGPGSKGQAVASFWRGDPEHSAAQLVVDTDGSVACLCDLATTAAYHATTSNDWSVGIELYQEADGSVWEATYLSAVKLVTTLCDALLIPRQISSRAYNGTIIQRMMWGGADMVGVFGHRDNAWDFKHNTSSRGRGDPGDEIYARLHAAGFEAFDYDKREDIAAWTRRQQFMVADGDRLQIDGLCGPGTLNAMHRRGIADGPALDVLAGSSAR